MFDSGVRGQKAEQVDHGTWTIESYCLTVSWKVNILGDTYSNTAATSAKCALPTNGTGIGSQPPNP